MMRRFLCFLLLLILTGCTAEPEPTDPLRVPDGINAITYNKDDTVFVDEYISHSPYDGTDENLTRLLLLVNGLTEDKITPLPDDTVFPKEGNFVLIVIRNETCDRYLHFCRLSDTECAFTALRHEESGQTWEHRFTFSSAECAELIRTVDEWYDKPENRVNELTE